MYVMLITGEKFWNGSSTGLGIVDILSFSLGFCKLLELISLKSIGVNIEFSIANCLSATVFLPLFEDNPYPCSIAISMNCNKFRFDFIKFESYLDGFSICARVAIFLRTV